MITPPIDKKRFPHITEEVFEQILIIRDTGKTNMFCLPTVRNIAQKYECYELVSFIDEHAREYVDFILNGKAKAN